MSTDNQAPDEIRCSCHQLMAKRCSDGIEIMCKRCGRLMIIGFDEIMEMQRQMDGTPGAESDEHDS